MTHLTSSYGCLFLADQLKERHKQKKLKKKISKIKLRLTRQRKGKFKSKKQWNWKIQATWKFKVKELNIRMRWTKFYSHLFLCDPDVLLTIGLLLASVIVIL